MIHYSVIENVSGVVCAQGRNAVIYTNNPEIVECCDCKKFLMIGQTSNVISLDTARKFKVA